MADDDTDQVLPPGKLPNALLKSLISRYVTPDASVIIGPGVGRDAAVIDLGDRVLVVKTDPITFATEDSGRYLVNVNANDIACMGGTPRWLLVTALLPERSTTPALVEASFRSLSEASSDIGVTLIGGHTEITLGLDRTILIGQMIGEATRESLIDPSSARAGDLVLLCSAIAIEGTALLAQEARLSLGNVPPDVLESAARLLTSPGISVLPAVRALRSAGVPLRALHDPTEGGLATALAELGESTGLGLEIDARAIPILPETLAVCDELGLDPLGLIASGSLLAVVPAGAAPSAIAALDIAGIGGAVIGHLTQWPGDRWLLRGDDRQELPIFAVDEIARFFASER